MIPRRNGANIYKFKSLNMNWNKYFESYDKTTDECITLVEGIALTLNFNLRYGDIVIDESIAGTISAKKITRKGVFIYNGKHLQYLDCTLNGSGSIPRNFPSFTTFSIGYWKDIFIDNILWIQAPQSYKIINNKLITPLYTIITTSDGMKVLMNLIVASESIITYNRDKNNEIYFDINLYNIYNHRKTFNI